MHSVSIRYTLLTATIVLGAAQARAASQEPGASRSIRVIEHAPGSGTDARPPADTLDPGAQSAPGPDGAKLEPRSSTPTNTALPGPQEPQPGNPPTSTAGLPGPGQTPAKPSSPPMVTPTPTLPSSAVVVHFQGKNRFAMGDNIQVQVRSQTSGYLVLVDVGSDGRITQIYPNIYTMAANGADPANGNAIKAGELVIVPDAQSPLANFDFVAGPPLGEGKLFAIVSDKPVQYIDLPDLPAEIKGDQVASYVQETTRSLRITSAGDGPLLDPRWSFGVASYVIGPQRAQAGQ
ncbi:hypothetical protein GCM10007036_23780 [Alsobacter metallidurans]|uniref:DUF4384 domain-containing protein n=1 Tax=Alsobacter metallidurans TaxID=340221 RepID=A0A917I6R1_9HYPH|nr:DUF4384 domain-containing protein [Alsobacter metallidurans]GGH20299.1 hypothetical protein GCM10007036_23780 [Alsobacter metallidurans]